MTKENVVSVFKIIVEVTEGRISVPTFFSDLLKKTGLNEDELEEILEELKEKRDIDIQDKCFKNDITLITLTTQGVDKGRSL